MSLTETVAATYENIQKEICSILEHSDGRGKFSSNHWENEIGRGVSCVLQNGNKIEKAGVNFSFVKGGFNSKLEALLGENAKEYCATGISSIIHPGNPYAPTIHMNVRYFALDNGTEWFGGGIDLTPIYIDVEEAKNFHKSIETICSRFNPAFYTEFKNQADEYFYIPHRSETRGIGGIFFNSLKPSDTNTFDDLFNFTIEISKAYPRIYSSILKEKSGLDFTPENVKWQKIRRGRYVEFNLLYDRGTKFGLESGGNIESILVSLPTDASWEYNYIPKDSSPEMETLKYLKKGINWVKI